MANVVTGITADGTYDGFRIIAPSEGTIEVYGDFDGGTVTLEISTDGGTTWRNFQSRDATNTVTDVTWSATEFKSVVPFPTGKYRFTLADSTSPSLKIDVNCLMMTSFDQV